MSIPETVSIFNLPLSNSNPVAYPITGFSSPFVNKSFLSLPVASSTWETETLMSTVLTPTTLPLESSSKLVYLAPVVSP